MSDRPPRYSRESAAAHLRQRDPDLGRLVEQVGPCTLAPSPEATLFDRLASSILSQQISVAAAATISRRLREQTTAQASEVPRPDAGGDPSTAFEPARLHLDPRRVAALADDRFRACGVSRPKVAALRALADAVLTERVPTMEALHELDDEEVVECLTAVRGIGRWTVQMLLIFQLDRPDVFPDADVGVRRGYELCLGLDRKAIPAEMRERAEVWAPYRSVASWYLWRALEL